MNCTRVALHRCGMNGMLESGLRATSRVWGLRDVKPTSYLHLIPVRGIKTTDTAHPEPVYSEDDRVLKKVLSERSKMRDDLPIGMTNPYEKPKKKCILCEHGITPNYKNVKLLYQFVSPYTGLMYDRHVTGLCKTKHEQVERQIRIASRLGLMAYYHKEVEFLKDPVLCDPERPLKPHKYM